jgi:hypothetical protein
MMGRTVRFAPAILATVMFGVASLWPVETALAALRRAGRSIRTMAGHG